MAVRLPERVRELGRSCGLTLFACTKAAAFSRGELARILLLVREHEPILLRRWYEYFAD